MALGLTWLWQWQQMEDYRSSSARPDCPHWHLPRAVAGIHTAS